MERIIVYIDGFNLYYGIKDSFSGKYKWLDLLRLSELFVTQSQQVEKVKYFTANIASDNQKMARQKTYLNALKNHCGHKLEIIKGRYLKKEIHCYTHQYACQQTNFSPCKNFHHHVCNGILSIPEEKKTDVNIATSMLVDCFQDRFDTAFLISADSDLVPPIQAIHQLYPKKRIIVFFPPGRKSYEIKQCVRLGDCREIKESHLQGALLPQMVTTSKGALLHKPHVW